jgi:nucleoside-diphosphate-sugar epimerase
MSSSAPLPLADLDHVLEHSRHWWTPWRGARLLITGGTGFFGRWLLESFAHINDRLGLGMQACALSRDPQSFAKRVPALAARSDLRLLQGDVRHFTTAAGPWDLVLHAAATSSHPIDDGEMSGTLVEGTRQVLRCAKDAGARRLLTVSSGAVYGRLDSTTGAVAEDHPNATDLTLQDNTYAMGKRLAEQLTLEAGQGGELQVSIARCFAFVGPQLPLNAHFAIGSFMRQALAEGSIRLEGDGMAVRSYLHAADLTLWLWGLLLRAPNQGIYNVGSSQPIQLAELAALVLQLAGARNGQVRLGSEQTSTQARPHYLPCTRRAHVQLGLRTLLPLNDAISRTLSWISSTQAHL